MCPEPKGECRGGRFEGRDQSGDRAGERRVGRRDTPLELDRRRRNRLQSLERFTATLERNDRGGTTAEIPFDVAAEFGSVRAPVLVTINGFKFRTRTMRYGGVYLLGLNREAREGAGVDAGDTVAVELELDQAPRDVTFRASWRARSRPNRSCAPSSTPSRTRIDGSTRAGSPRRSATRRAAAGSSGHSACCVRASRHPTTPGERKRREIRNPGRGRREQRGTAGNAQRLFGVLGRRIRLLIPRKITPWLRLRWLGEA